MNRVGSGFVPPRAERDEQAPASTGEVCSHAAEKLRAGHSWHPLLGEHQGQFSALGREVDDSLARSLRIELDVDDIVAAVPPLELLLHPADAALLDADDEDDRPQVRSSAALAWVDSEAIGASAPDAALEAALLTASPDFVELVGDGLARGRYLYSRIDLDDDDRPETFVYTLGPYFCGSGGCSLFLFSGSEEGYELLGTFALARTPVIVSSTVSEGRRDFFRLESGGGAAASWVLHRFDGEAWRESERQAGDEQPAGTPVLAGDFTWDDGLPLEPPASESTARGARPSDAPLPDG